VLMSDNCVSQIKELMSGYVRKGSKENRSRQVKKMIYVINFIEAQEKLGDLNRLGKRQIIAFWKSHEHLSEKTRYEYWRALDILFKKMSRKDIPPKPFSISENKPVFPMEIQTLLDRVNLQKASMRLSVKALAKRAGCDESVIRALDSQPGKLTLDGLSRILTALNSGMDL
jgi:hypothetical protein